MHRLTDKRPNDKLTKMDRGFVDDETTDRQTDMHSLINHANMPVPLGGSNRPDSISRGYLWITFWDNSMDIKLLKAIYVF
jgi:hypothetical protein